MPGKFGSSLLVAVLLLVPSAIWAQSSPAGPSDVNLALTANGERAQVAPNNCCFWMFGPSVDFGMTFWHGFGVAAELFGDRAASIAPNLDLSKIDYFAGPRYTRHLRLSGRFQHRVDVFGQTLLGGVHAYNTVIPVPGKTENSANAFAMELGGGADLRLLPHLGLRVIQADYLYSQLPNNASGTQNDFRIGAGVLFHFR
jgi:outer membrane immunogenic protein